MSCEIIDAVGLFDAIRKKEDDFWKAACIITMEIPHENKIKLANTMIKKPSAKAWFNLKLCEYEYDGGDDDYA